jgi:hypothetical protein
MSTDIINQNLRNVIQICYEMLEIADRGDGYRQDSGCGAVYGRLRDAAYKIRLQAEHELLCHESGDTGHGSTMNNTQNKTVHKPQSLKGKKDE